MFYRARRGGSGALYPQSAIAGLNSCPRHESVKSVMLQSTMTIGSCATQNCEPRQIREEAAVSGPLGVPQVCLVRVRSAWYVCIFLSTAGARFYYDTFTEPSLRAPFCSVHNLFNKYHLNFKNTSWIIISTRCANDLYDGGNNGCRAVRICLRIPGFSLWMMIAIFAN
jgi:hypothetical protein